MSSVNSTASCMQVNDLKKSRTLTDMKQVQAKEDEGKEMLEFTKKGAVCH